MVANPEGFGKSVEEKVEESFNHYGCSFTKIGGENAAYGNLEYIIIESNQALNSEVMQSIAYNTRVTEI